MRVDKRDGAKIIQDINILTIVDPVEAAADNITRFLQLYLFLDCNIFELIR